MRIPTPRLKPLRIALIYGAFGTTWIFVTDWLASDGAFRMFPFELQTLKGLFYVALTAALVYLLIRIMTRDVARERTWYRELFELNPDPMWVYDLGTLRFLAVNKAAVSQYGYTRAEFLSMTLADIRPPEDVPLLKRHLSRTAEGGIRAGVWRHTLKNGRVIRAEVSAHTVDFAGRRAEMVLAHDLTRRLEAEDGVRAARDFLDAVVSCSPLALLSIDPEGRVLSWNASAQRIFGWTERETVGRPVPFVREEKAAEFAKLRRQVMDGSILTGVELTRIRKDGSPVDISLSAARLTGPDRTGIGVLALIEDITQRKLSEAARTAAEQRLRLVLNAINEGIVALDEGGLITGANPAAVRLLGWPESVLQGKLPQTLFHRDEAGPLSHALESGEPCHDVDAAFTRRDGSRIFVEYSCAPLADASGTTGAVVTFRDVTEKRVAEEALRASEARFRELAENISDVFYNYDPHAGRFLYASPAYVRAWGRTLDDLYENPASFTDAVHPEDRGRFLETLPLKKNGEPTDVEYRMVRPDGQIRWIRDRSYPVHDAEGRVVRTVGVARNITDRALARQAQDESENSLRHLTRQLAREKIRLETAQTVAKIGNWETELASGSAAWSAETFRIFGLEPSAFQPSHESFLTRVHPDDRRMVNEAFEASAESGAAGLHAVTHRILLPDGSEKTVEERWRVAHGNDGKPVRAYGTCQDVTERVKLETQIRQSQKMDAIGQLAGGIAHDFNNMLTVILVRAEQALRHAGEGTPLQSALREIHTAANRSAELTRHLLTYARRQAVRPRHVDLNAAVEGMLAMLRRLIGENIELSWNPGDNVSRILIDPAQIDQLLTNLCVNSRDAIGDVGRVLIETRDVHLTEEDCRRRGDGAPGRYVMLAVSDNGEGMDKDVLSHMFEPFFTTKEVGKGTGLGLATVYGIVQQNGGFIRVYSEPGNGTTFTIYLAASAAAVGSPDAAAAAAPERARGEKVLLVEDESMILDVTAEMLAELGYEVVKAKAPDEAARLAATPAGRADILLTDMVMPGMNGRDLSERIRTLQPGIRCVFMSGYTANVMTQRAILNESVTFLQKPFSTAELSFALRKALDRPSPPETASPDPM